jgi:hypothetical protein
MKSTFVIRSCAISIGSIPLLWMAAANAAHPPSIAGNWAVTANQTLGTLVIVQPASAAICKPITGNIFGNPIQGNYCPSTGRVVFARQTGAGIPFQLYQGHVSRDAPVDRVGGSFLIWNAAGGVLPDQGVDFNFSGTK